jgi:hypothetical protein
MVENFQNTMMMKNMLHVQNAQFNLPTLIISIGQNTVLEILAKEVT